MSTTFDLATLSLEEKAALGSGASFWRTEQIGGVPSIMLTDGPHGLRKQPDGGDHLGLGGSVPATCFPPATGIGQTWNTDLVRAIGRALGEECRAEGVAVLLGPGVNIRRSPLGGRNFEYFSEDPVLSAALGTAWVEGLQSQGVGASLKHFVANEQETDRQRVSSDIDPRTLREVYLRAFQRVVEEAQPWTVMTSYNRVNGEYAAESAFLITEVLRGEWGFQGAVVSDWGGAPHRVASVAAGLDLEMPSSAGRGDRAVVDAVREGRLNESHVNAAAQRVAELALKAAGHPRTDGFDAEAHHELARRAARQSVVLLQNHEELLPLATTSRLAIIGELAEEPRIQGAGSSRVNPTRVDVPIEEIRQLAEAPVEYARGYNLSGGGDGALRREAVAIAARSDAAVLFLGLPPHLESEGWDREDIELPREQVELAKEILEVNPRTVIVLTHGGTVRLTPLLSVPAILDAALLGQGGARAIAEILFGIVNPSGHLTETVPLRLEDTPSYLSFPGEHGHSLYGEGIFVGYKGFDRRAQDVAFPFGHGLSYTTFAYSDLRVSAVDDGILAQVDISNAGGRTGRAVPQFYVSKEKTDVVRPPLELKAFTSVEVAPGETVTASALLRRADLAYWDVRRNRWTLETGTYSVHAGESSRDLRVTADIDVVGDETPVRYTPESTIGELMANTVGARFIQQLMGAAGAATDSVSETLGSDAMRAMAAMPAERIVMMSGGVFTDEALSQVIAAANAASDARS